MTDSQWESLLRVIGGQLPDPPAVGFLVDGPWFAALQQTDLMHYLTDNQCWLQANLAAARQFPQALWIPGFWAEFGMISNPPSFGARCIWPEQGFPTCERVLADYDAIDALVQPDVRTDGLLPLIVQRLKSCQAAVEQAGHRYRFACAHGPLTIASYLLGHTEFLIGMRTEPAAIHRLLQRVTQFVIDWLTLQKQQFPSIDGILILDDLMGFVGDQDFREFVLPYAQPIFACLDVAVRFLHNDAYGLVTAPHLQSLGVNLFNFSFEHDLQEMRRLAGDTVTLMGNIPPRDVLALGSPEDVGRSVRQLLDTMSDRRRVIVSAGGFTHAQFSPDKVAAFCDAAGIRNRS
jgi:uroporphyrinogen decarboxylase